MKKILTSFLSLVLVFIAVLTLAPNVFAADDSDELALNILVYTEELEAVELAIPMTGKLGFKVELSLETLSMIYDKDTGFFVHNGNKIDGPSHQFTISGSTTVYLILKDAEDVVAVYLDSNTKVLDVQFGTSPVYDGPTPTKSGYEFNKFYPDVETISEDTIFVADYTLVKEDEIEITIHGGTTDQETYLYNDIVTLAPDNEEDFLYWADMDGQVVSSNPNYAFSALVPTELQAVYEGSYVPTFSVYLTNVTGIAEGRQSFLGYINNPEGVEVVEHGLLVSTDVKVLTLSNATKLPSTALVPHTNEFLMSGTAGTYKSFRAYTIYMVEDEPVVVYSDNNFVIEQTLVEQTFIETFENSTLTATYANNSIVGVTGVTFNIIHGRNEGSGTSDDYSIDGKGIMLRRADEPSSITFTITGGLVGLSFDYRKAFTAGGTARTYKVDVTNNGNTITYDIPSFGSGSGADATVHKFTYTGPALTGEVTIKIYATGAAGNQQATFDNISWTEISGQNIDSKLYSVDFYNGNTKVHTEEVLYNTTLESYDLIVPGYDLIGWTLNGDSFSFDTPIKSNIKLDAVLDVHHWDVIFVDGENLISNEEGLAFGTSLAKPLDPNKLGYDFIGWFLDEDMEEEVVWPYIIPDKDSTLYAKFEPKEYTITFDTLGGSEIESITLPYGSKVNAPEETPEKEGFNFVGWFLDEEGTQVVDFEELTMPIDGLTIYAKWVDATIKYTVSFDLNGGVGEIDAQELSAGETAVEPEDPTKEGFVFKGWFLDEELTEAYDFETPVTENITLYAKWNALHTVSFDLNDGEGVIEDIIIENGLSLEKPEDPTKDGYRFVGWFLSLEDEDAVDFPMEVTTDTVLHAKWIKQYVVSFDLNGGTGTFHDIPVDENGTLDEPTEIPTKAGFDFVGWFEADAEVAFNFTTPVTDDLVLFAKWEEQVIQPPTEQLLYTENFTSGFTAGTNYQLNNVKQGPIGKQWTMFFGTVSTNSAIDGNSVQFRWYSTGGNENKWGTATTDFKLYNVSRIQFDAKRNDGSYNIKVWYSLDGSNWIGEEEFMLTTTSKTYEYDLPGEYVNGGIYIRFGLSGTGSSGKGITFDNVKVYGFPE